MELPHRPSVAALIWGRGTEPEPRHRAGAAAPDLRSRHRAGAAAPIWDCGTELEP